MDVNEQFEWFTQAPPAPVRESRPRSASRTWFLRILIAFFVAIILAGASLYAVTMTAPDAAKACAVTAQSKVQRYTGATVEFQIFGPGGLGWECYALDSQHVKRHLVSLGLNPAFADLPLGIDV